MTRLYCLALAVLLSFCSVAAWAAEAREYNTDLATLYHEHQRVLAMRDACETAQPLSRADFAAAYEDWRTRHARLLDDLENRFAAVIKRASKDQADYSRNYGKYQLEVLEMREDSKRMLLAQNKDKLAEQCKEFPAYLRHPRSDIRALYPDEYRHIYRVR